MSNCSGGCGCSSKSEGKGPKNFIDQMIENVQNAFLKDGPAVNCVSDHDTYLYLLGHAPFYVSGIHCRDGEQTWWAAAVNREAYDEWEETVEHQHHPQEQHEHYLCNNAKLEN